MSWQQSYDLLEETLAASAAMRTFLGAADAAAAKARIYQDVLPPPASNAEAHSKADLIALRPYVLLSSEDAFAKYRQVRTASGCWSKSGSMWAMVQRNAPSSGTPEAAQQSFRTSIGSIIEELATLSEDGSGAYLHFLELEAEGPWRVARDQLEELGDHEWVILRFVWGPEAGRGSF